MKTLLIKMLFAVVFIFSVTSCDIQNSVSTISDNNLKDDLSIASYHMEMSIVQNGDNASYFLYGGDEVFSIYGSSDDIFSTWKDENSTFDVKCIYSWQNHVSPSVAGLFRITGDNFSWNSGYFYPSGSNGTDTAYYTVNLQEAKSYHAIMWNSTFDEYQTK